MVAKNPLIFDGDWIPIMSIRTCSKHSIKTQWRNLVNFRTLTWNSNLSPFYDSKINVQPDTSLSNLQVTRHQCG